LLNEYCSKVGLPSTVHPDRLRNRLQPGSQPGRTAHGGVSECAHAVVG
jgi:hypothetical protein